MELRMVQSDLAILWGVCEDTITGWENSRSTPKIYYYPSIISFLGYNPLKIDISTVQGKIFAYRFNNNGLTYKTLGKMVEVDASTIRKWELGESIPRKGARTKLNDVIAS